MKSSHTAIRRSEDRGHFDHGWLKTYHTFSFADYYDPRFEKFGSLRVINEDIVQPEGGFSPHSHRDMEIVTYILKGALEHKDSMGNTSVIRAGEVQRMSAGRGVTHSEYNASKTEAVHLLQIWIYPEKRGLEPEYEQKLLPEKDRTNQLRLIVSPSGEQGALKIHQDARIYDAFLETGKSLKIRVEKGRMAWLQLSAGEIKLTDEKLAAGDGASLTQAGEIEVAAAKDASFLLFDLKASGPAK